MEIVWTDKAKESFKETLEFWDIHNGSYLISDKILLETDRLMLELSNNTLYLGRYIKTLILYVRPILKCWYFSSCNYFIEEVPYSLACFVILFHCRGL